jgi:hypothetical protein
MRKEYDFVNAKPNPYIKNLREQVSLRTGIDNVVAHSVAAVSAVEVNVDDTLHAGTEIRPVRS